MKCCEEKQLQQRWQSSSSAQLAPSAKQPLLSSGWEWGKMPSPKGTACSRHYTSGEAWPAIPPVKYLSLKVPPENLCLMKMMIQRMFSCSSPRGSAQCGCFFFSLILLGLHSSLLHLDALCIQLD